MQRIIGLFLDQIATDRGQRVNITDWTAWLAYDLMGKVAFGRDFGSLERARENPTVTRVRGAMKYLGILFPVPWLINVLGHIPGASGEMAPFFEYCKQLVKDKQKAGHSQTRLRELPITSNTDYRGGRVGPTQRRHLLAHQSLQRRRTLGSTHPVSTGRRHSLPRPRRSVRPPPPSPFSPH